MNIQRLKRFYKRKELLTSDEDDTEIEFKQKYSDKPESKLFKNKKLTKQKAKEKDEKQKQKVDKQRMKKKSEIILSESYSSSSTSTPSNESSVESSSLSNQEKGDRPLLRRSTRRRGVTDQWGYTSFVTLLLLCFLIGINGLTTTDPLIWHKDTQPVIDGMEAVTTVINYKSPCKLFTNVLIDETATEKLKLWCEDEYRNSFITPLNSFCKAVGPRNSTRFALAKLIYI